MCSYNQINGTVSCENGGVLHTLLKEEVGSALLRVVLEDRRIDASFHPQLNAHSMVVSDWYAVNNGTNAAINGTDILQPFVSSLLSSVRAR